MSSFVGRLLHQSALVLQHDVGPLNKAHDHELMDASRVAVLRRRQLLLHGYGWSALSFAAADIGPRAWPWPHRS
jgi:hypothetical protein